MVPVKILIVEDDRSDLMLLRRALHNQNSEIQIEHAKDGEIAIDLIHSMKTTQSGHPDLVLLDLHLPKYDGLEVLRAYRQLPALQNRHVVVVTNGASPQEVAELEALHADYRLKPRGLPEFDDLAADLIALCTSFQTSNC